MIIKLIKDTKKQELESFDSGSEELDIFLKCFAHQNDKSGVGRTFVGFSNNQVVGFMTLCSGSIAFNQLPSEMNKKLPRYPIPAIRIARLAVDKRYQKQGFGKEFLEYCFEKVAAIANLIGVKLVIVDVKDETFGFYKHYGFVSLPTKPNILIMPIETVIKAINR